MSFSERKMKFYHQFHQIGSHHSLDSNPSQSQSQSKSEKVNRNSSRSSTSRSIRSFKENDSRRRLEIKQEERARSAEEEEILNLNQTQPTISFQTHQENKKEKQEQEQENQDLTNTSSASLPLSLHSHSKSNSHSHSHSHSHELQFLEVDQSNQIDENVVVLNRLDDLNQIPFKSSSNPNPLHNIPSSTSHSNCFTFPHSMSLSSHSHSDPHLNSNTHSDTHSNSHSNYNSTSNPNAHHTSSNSHSNPSIITPSISPVDDLTLEFPIRLDTRDELISILESILGSHRLSNLVTNLQNFRIDPNQSSTHSNPSTLSPPLIHQTSKHSSTSDLNQSKGLLKRLGWRTRAITLLSIRPTTTLTSNQTSSIEQDPKTSFRLFGAPLSESASASCVTIIGGQKHRLPILIFKSVEEIYSRGLGTNGLFRTNGNPIRIQSLINAFESAPSYGDSLALDREEIFDLCDLLKRFLSSLPLPLLEPDLSELFWSTCVNEESAEKLPIATRVTIAQVIFRLLPTRSFSLLVYLIAFLSQIPLFPTNQLTLQTISQIFGPALLAPRSGKIGTIGLGIDHHSSSSESNISKEISQRAIDGLTWLQTHWNQITDGLLDERIRYPPSQPELPLVPNSPRALTIVEEASFESDRSEAESEKRDTSYQETRSEHEIELDSTIGLATSPDTRHDPSFDSRHPTMIPYDLSHHSTSRRSVSLRGHHLHLSPSVTSQLRKANDPSRSISLSSSAKKLIHSRPTSSSRSLIDYPQPAARISSVSLSRHLDPSLSITSEPVNSSQALSESSSSKNPSHARPISSSQSLFDYTQSNASKSWSDIRYHPDARSSVLPESSETLLLPRSVSATSVHKMTDAARTSCSQSLTEAFGKTRSSPASHFRRDSETSNASITLSSASFSSVLITPVQSNLTRMHERFPSKISKSETEPILLASSPRITTPQSTVATSFGASLSNAQSIVDQYEAHGPDQLRKIIDSFKGQDQRERRVSACMARCDSCTSVPTGDLNRYSLRPASIAGSSPKPCSCPVNLRPGVSMSRRTKRSSPTSLSRKATQVMKRIGVLQEETSEEDSDPIEALSVMMRSKNGMIRAQAETIKAQAELLAETEKRLAVAAASSHNSDLESNFLPLLNSFENLSSETRKKCENEVKKLRIEWERERREREEEKVESNKKLMITLQDYEKVCDQLSVIRRAIGEGSSS